MRTMKLIGSVVIVLGVFLGLNAGRVLAQGHDNGEQAEKAGHSHERAALHEGSVTMTKQHHFEVVFDEKEVRVYAYTMKQDPIFSLKGVSGSVRLQSKGGDTASVKLSYVADSVATDSTHKAGQGYLVGMYDFSDVKEGTMRASFSLEGLSNAKEKTVMFRESVKLQHDDDHEGKEHGEHEEDEGGDDHDEGGHHEEGHGDH